MSDIETAPLAPLNARTKITEADRAKVYALIGKQLNDLVNGPASNYPDGGRKSPQVISEDIKRLNGHVMNLKGFVDDPAGILDSVVKHLDDFRRGLDGVIKKEEPYDHNTISPVPPPDDNVIDPDSSPNAAQPSTPLFGLSPFGRPRSPGKVRDIRYVSGIRGRIP